MTHAHPALASIRAVFFDMDGVIYVGNRPLPGVQELLDYLDATGRRWMLVTNNAALTSQQFSDKVAAMGLRVAPERILLLTFTRRAAAEITGPLADVTAPYRNGFPLHQRHLWDSTTRIVINNMTVMIPA
jgi:hypothetical protein